MAEVGAKCKIRRIGGAEKTRHHLMELGFVVDAFVTVVSSSDGNLIVAVKDSRVAINSDLAMHIMV